MASKDLQIVRARSVRLSEPSSVISNAETSSQVNPIALVLDALRRHWIVIVLVTAVSGAGAWIISGELEKETVTGQLILEAQSLPVGDDGTYRQVTPGEAVSLIRSMILLQDIVDKHGLVNRLDLETSRDFVSMVSASAQKDSNRVSVELTLEDRQLVLAVLNDIGDSFVRAVSEQRKEILKRDEQYIADLKLKAQAVAEDSALKLLKYQAEASEEQKGDTRQQAELTRLLTRLAAAEGTMDRVTLRNNQLELRRQTAREEMLALELDASAKILAGRRRQFEELDGGVKRVSRVSEKRESIIQQLDDLQNQLPELFQKWQKERAEQTEVAAAPVEGTDGPSKVEAADEQPADASPRNLADTETLRPAEAMSDKIESADDERLNSVDAWLPFWVDQVRNAGIELIPDFDPPTSQVVAEANERLSEYARSVRDLDLEIQSNLLEGELAREKARAAYDEIKVATADIDRPISLAERNIINQLAVDEERHKRLTQQHEQIVLVRDCTIPDFKILSKATAGGLVSKSNRKKLFVFAMFGSELLLLSPVVLLELWRARAAPVTVLSRRWNLPILGLPPGQLSSAANRSGKNALTTDHDLRLMALRIQQSLFQPKGRVVLFSGIDHEESPIGLIRSLSRCFAQREETVLVIQAFAGDQLSTAGNRRLQEQPSEGRPGVAEYLSGEVDQIESLTSRTDLQAVDFLSAGRKFAGTEAMASSRMTTMIEQCRNLYSMILVVGPSTLHPADLQMLAARADGIVFTVTDKSLKGPFGQEVIGDLIELGAPILGFAEQPSADRHPSRSEDWVLESNKNVITA